MEIWTDCYFAERGGAEYRAEIKRQIKQADIAVLLLSPEFLQSKFIMTEEFPEIKAEYLERKERTEIEGISRRLQIIPNNISDPFTDTYKWIIDNFQTLPNDQEYLSDYKQDVNRWERVKPTILNSFRNAVKEVRSDKEAEELTRHRNNKYQFDDRKEANRLEKQTNLFHKYDIGVYDWMFKGRKGCSVLDVGCNNGNNIAVCMGDRPEVSVIVGIDRVEGVIENAKESYEAPKYLFSCMDCCAVDFKESLRKLMEERGIESFDIIHISMVLLHLQDPETTLAILREYLSEDGCLFIRDIDDSLKLAYPDSSGRFERAFSICDKDHNSGYRSSGRGIYSLLVKAGCHSIELHRKGLDIIGMSKKDKNDFFDVCFSYIEEDLKYLAEIEPNNYCWQENLEWFEKNYNSMDKEFVAPGFFFQAGFMVYTARK